jgi:hypothetical protein
MLLISSFFIRFFSLFSCLPLVFYAIDVQTLDIYRWIDSKGQIHFESKKKEKTQQPWRMRSLSSIQWITPSIPFFSLPTQKPSFIQRREKGYLKAKKQTQKNCLKIKKRIHLLYLKLKSPLKIRTFDAYQSQLRQLRWNKRKNCSS